MLQDKPAAQTMDDSIIIYHVLDGHMNFLNQRLPEKLLKKYKKTFPRDSHILQTSWSSWSHKKRSYKNISMILIFVWDFTIILFISWKSVQF